MKRDRKHKVRGAEEGKAALRAAQIELVKLQRDVIRSEKKILVILERRDSAGKDGTIKRIAQHLSPRETRIVAPAFRPIGTGDRGIFSATSRIFPLGVR